MKLRERLLAALIEERFPASAIEAERVDFAEEGAIRVARVLLPRVLALGLDPARLQEIRRERLELTPEPSREELAAVPPRPLQDRPASALVGKPRSGMDDRTLAAVRAADRMRKRAERTPA